MEISRKKEKRKAIKKAQRKYRRRKVAQTRDVLDEEAQTARQKDPGYHEWLQQQEKLERFERDVEERQSAEAEEAWLRHEALAQRHFQLERRRQAVIETVALERREQQERELAEREVEERRVCEERKRLAAEAAAEFECTMARIQQYLDDPLQPELPPAELRRCVESRPGEKLCEFFERTNCCRYGASCQYNHRRPLLSRCLMMHHFYQHPLLEQTSLGRPDEYDSSEASLETSERELRADYDEFFTDVLPELERYGHIKNFLAARNVQPHLRGHVFVEYMEERAALKAFVQLQGRFYATKRLNVEFSNLKTWRNAICGLSLSRSCLKGPLCNYLHLFGNPDTKYNMLLEKGRQNSQSLRQTVPPTAITPKLLSWSDIDKVSGIVESRNWRWSVSPEPPCRIPENTTVVEVNRINSPKHAAEPCKADANTTRSNSRERRARKHKKCSTLETHESPSKERKQIRRSASRSRKHETKAARRKHKRHKTQ